MLQNLRENLRGTVAVIVIGLMIVPLVLFGVDAIFVNQGNANNVAEVNGTAITEVDLQRAIVLRQNQMRAQFGDDLPPQLLAAENLRESVLEGLIRRELLIQAVANGGMTVPDQMLNQIIVSAPEFQVDGRFNADMYRQRVYNVGYTPAGYRRQLAQDMVLNQHMIGLTESSFITDTELAQIVALSQQERSFYYLTIPLAAIEAEQQISEDQARAYYEAHKAEFRNPEQVQIEYLEVSLAQIMDEIDIPEEQLRAQYEQEVAAFRGQAERHAAHILIEPRRDGSDEAVLKEIQQKLAAGEDFAALAEEYSEDFGTRAVGGDLGVSDGTVFPRAFEQALAQLEVGEVSDPVRTDAGYHLIKLLGVQGAEPPSYEQEKNRIANVMRRSEAERRFLELSQDLADVTFSADSLVEAGNAIGLDAKVAGPFSRDGGFGIASNPVVVATAFRSDVLEEGHPSEVLELGPGHALVLRVTNHQEARTLAFDEVRTEIERTLKREAAIEQASTLANTLKAEINAGKSVEDVAKEHGYEWQVSLNTQRGAGNVNRDILREVFSLPLPGGAPIVSSFPTSDGNYAVVSLTQVKPGDIESMSTEEKAAFRQRLADMASDYSFAAYQQALEQSSKIKRPQS